MPLGCSTCMEAITETFVTSSKKHGHTFYSAVRVETQEVESVPEHHKFSRWFKSFGHLIQKVRTVRVAQELHMEGYPLPDFTAKHIPWHTYLEVHTAHGMACIVDFASGSEVQGVIIHQGRKSKSYALGTWRKHGSKVGHGMAWLRAYHGRNVCTSPAAGRDICCAEAYGRMGDPEFAVFAAR